MKNTKLAAPGGRMEWMDILRGAAIILVAFNHGVLYTTTNDGNVPEWMSILNEIVAPIRMPLMVFLSGMLLPRSLAKGNRHYINGKLRALVYPYFVWSIIVLVIDTALKRFRDPGPYLDPVAMLYEPYAHLWFLYYLFVYYMVAMALARVPALLIAGVSLGVAFVVPEDYHRFFVLLAFFMLGRLVAERNATFLRLLERASTGIVSGLLASLLIVLAILGESLRYVPLYSPLAFAAVVFFIWLSTRIRPSHASSALQYVGRNSLIFYIIHWYPMLIGVELGLSVAEGQGWVPVLLGTVTGMVAGLIASLVIARLPKLKLLFEFPKSARLPATASDKT